ncbi:MAG: alkaline phosphatase family protein [Marmoricola sp.]
MRPLRVAAVLVALLLPLLGCSTTDAAHASRPAAAVGTSGSAAPSGPRHVFVVNIENEDFATTWGSRSAAPYLAHTLRSRGVLLTRYHGTAHHSLSNYLAQVSGQGPTRQVQADCRRYTALRTVRVAAYQQRVGDGCVYDAATPTLMKQLDRAHVSWRGYMQGMTRRCEHPALGAIDTTQGARPGHEYAARHDPFVYFRSVTSRPSYCRSHVVGLGELTRDLASVSTTRALSYITPDLCNDAHDSPCVDGRAGGLAQVDTWMRRWIPRILASPAFGQDGMLVITADEADDDASACCGEGRTPNVAAPGLEGPGGGRIGALVISQWTRPGSTSTRAYNHYGLLATLEDTFGVSRIGYARLPQVHPFGSDVYDAG